MYVSKPPSAMVIKSLLRVMPLWSLSWSRTTVVGFCVPGFTRGSGMVPNSRRILSPSSSMSSFSASTTNVLEVSDAVKNIFCFGEGVVLGFGAVPACEGKRYGQVSLRFGVEGNLDGGVLSIFYGGVGGLGEGYCDPGVVVVGDVDVGGWSGALEYPVGEGGEGDLEVLVVIVDVVLGGGEGECLCGLTGAEDDIGVGGVILSGKIVVERVGQGDGDGAFRVHVQVEDDGDGLGLLRGCRSLTRWRG